MKKVILLLLFASSYLKAQPVYQPNEVDKQAEPLCGIALLNEFISANVQIPFSSGYRGISTRVFVKGVIETDGSMSQLEVVKGADSLCNREAIRVLKLFRAWQPALLKDKPVRQTMIYSVPFKAEKVSNFDSTSWSMIDYYDAKFQPTNDIQLSKYKSILKVDRAGNINADIVYLERFDVAKWKKLVDIPFKQKEIWYKISTHAEDSVKAYKLSAEDETGLNYVPAVTLDEKGHLLFSQQFRDGGKPKLTKKYYLNGTLMERRVFSDSTSIDTRWYDNGQLMSVMQNAADDRFGYTEEMQVFTVYDSHGKQVVKEGNGWLNILNASGQEPAVERGEVVFGKRNGKWVGKLADSTVYCEEIYQNGKFIEGKVFKNGETITYHEKARQATFKGGNNALYEFLGRNIVYPAESSRKNITGRVFLSFVVSEQGDPEDITIVRGVSSDIDKEAIRVIKKMKGMFRPGMLRGQLVKVKFNLPINFQTQ